MGVVWMRRSDLFLPTSREVRGSGSETTRLLQRAGLIREFGSGLWGYAPAGYRVREKLVDRVEAAMDDVGAQQVQLPGLQYRERWEQSGRWANFEDEMFTFTNRDGQDVCLAPSHEEGMVHLVDGLVRSYDDLPLLVYQVASKYRDDHARNGLVRCKEFTMKDAYSFHLDRTSVRETYRRVREAYEALLDDLGVTFAVVDADNSVMGGAKSEEFVAPAPNGGDRLVYCTADACRFGVTDEHDRFADHHAGERCPECGGDLAVDAGIEVGHVFDLGTRYSEAMDLTVDTADGGVATVEMASYGLGIDRLFQTLVEQHGTADGCGFPVTDAGCVAPYRAAVVPVGYEGEVAAVADDIHDALGETDVLLFDDDTRSVGERFAEAELLGIPATVVVGNGYREDGLVDVEARDGTTVSVAPDDVSEAVADVVGNA
jgi:prolyl-tRNA synthetase